MSGVQTLANPRRIKAAHRRRRKVASGQSVQRYYDPGIGRFLSVDPVTADGNTGGNFNRYWYGNNNPYKFTDPDGRQSASVMDQRYVYPHLDSGQQAELEAQHNEIGEQAYSGMKLGAVLFVGGYTGFRVSPLVRSPNFKYSCVLAIACMDPKAALLKGANETIKQSGRSGIVKTINAARSIGEPVNLSKVVVKGPKAVASVVGAPSGVALGTQGSGVHSGQYNSETGVADVRKDRETGSMIRKSEKVCVDAKKC